MWTRFRNGSLVFPVVDEGSGPPVVLLHGFPQDSTSWDAVVPYPLASGLRTLRPDQRGYAASARPTSTNDYRVVLLVADVVSLLDAAGGCWADPATPTGCGHCSSRSAPPAAVETAVRLMADRDRVRAMVQ